MLAYIDLFGLLTLPTKKAIIPHQLPMGISQYRLAKEIHVPLRRVNEIAFGRRGISADTALRFARFFGTTPEVLLSLQSQYEMYVAKGSIWKNIAATIKPALDRVACL